MRNKSLGLCIFLRQWGPGCCGRCMPNMLTTKVTAKESPGEFQMPFHNGSNCQAKCPDFHFHFSVRTKTITHLNFPELPLSQTFPNRQNLLSKYLCLHNCALQGAASLKVEKALFGALQKGPGESQKVT